MKYLIILLKTCYYCLIAVTFIIGTAFILSMLKIPGIPKTFAVQSGSMSPSISTGSIIVVTAQNNYQKGDIITFSNDKKIDLKHTTTHRITGVVKDGRNIFYQTKGDANKTPDISQVASAMVLGKVIFTVPGVGYFVAWATSLKGFITLIIIPATIIVYIELVNIKKELTGLIIKRRKTAYDLLIEHEKYTNITL